jgi:hypothetical protein
MNTEISDKQLLSSILNCIDTSDLVKSACKKGDFPLVKYLLNNYEIRYTRKLLLEESCKGGNLELVKLFFDCNHQDLNSLLCEASHYGHLDVVKYLVSKGADIKANKSNALDWAVTGKAKIFDTVKYLIDNGADPVECYAVGRAFKFRNGHVAQFILDYYYIPKGIELPDCVRR